MDIMTARTAVEITSMSPYVYQSNNRKVCDLCLPSSMSRDNASCTEHICQIRQNCNSSGHCLQCPLTITAVWVNLAFTPTGHGKWAKHWLERQRPAWLAALTELEEASTHKNAKTHAGIGFVTHDLTSDTRINGFPGLIMEHLCVKYADLSHTGFRDIVQK